MQPAHETVARGSAGPSAPAAALAALTNTLFGKLFFLIPLGIIGNIIFSFVVTDRAMVRSVVHVAPGYFVLAAVLCIVPWFTGSLRLFLWSRFLGGKIRYWDVFRIVIGAELGAAVSPPLIAGSAVKISMLIRRGFTGGAALSLSVLESLEDSVFFLFMVPIALTLSSSWGLPIVKDVAKRLGHPAFWVLLAGIAAALCIVITLARRSGWLRKAPVLRTLVEAIKSSYRNFKTTFHTIASGGKSIFALTMALTTFQWLCRYSVISLLLAGMGIPVQPLLYMALQVIVFALVTFVPTPGGAGGAEAMFSLLYRAFLPAGAIGVVTTAWRFLTFYFLVLVAAVLALLLGMQHGEAARPREEQGIVS
jgi:glycosyltransferase 2 family protein